jgi:macrolide transport system ATP-binding/permease protein
VSFTSRAAALWRNLIRRDRVDRDLDAELHATLDLLAAEKMRAGMRPADARRRAAIELGGLEPVKEQVREVKAGASIELLLQDLRYAARTLRRAPMFAFTAALSLGIGIAGNAVVFSVADAFLFRYPSGIASPDRLAEVGRTDTGEGGGIYSGEGFDTFSYPNYLDYRARQTVFDGLAAYHVGGLARFGLGLGDEAVPVPGAYVSANYFDVLGVQMARGRGFLPEDERLDHPNTVAVISHRLWQTQFNGTPDIVGRAVRLNGRPFTIIGVTQASFNGYTIDDQRLWVPITAYPDGDDLKRVALRGRQWLMGIGRLKPGVTTEQARDEMSRIARGLQHEFPDENRRHGLAVESAGAIPVDLRPVMTRFLALLSALVGLVLLIACFNATGMLLARGVTRAPELGMRLALGAARMRVVRLLVVESLTISLAGAIVGLVVASWVISLLERAIPLLPNFALSIDLFIDWRVIAFSVGLALVTGLASGLGPALAATRVELAAILNRDRSGGAPRLRARSVFVVAQVALSVLLVVCALLLTRSIRHATQIDPGFRVAGVEVIGLNHRLGGYDAERGRVFADALMERIQSLPGLEAAAAARVVPLTMEREGGRFWLPGEVGTERAIDGSQNIVTPGFFRTVGLELIAGRNFNETDRAGAPAVAIVNETLARRAWPGETAVGKRILVGAGRRPIDVIGVVRDAKYRTIGESPSPFFYVPAAQRYEPISWILVRPSGPSLIPQVREVIREMEPNLPVVQAGTLADMTAFTLFPQRLAAWLAAIVSAIGIFLAALGVYGIAAYNASLRTREIGIRVALGAVRAQVLQLILGHAGRLAAVGTACGVVAAGLATGLLEGMLYGVRPLDPISFAGGAIVFGALALVASLIPAWRAASVNPVDALRAQ